MTSQIYSTSFICPAYKCEVQTQSFEGANSHAQGSDTINECSDASHTLNIYPKEIQKMFCNMFTTPKFIEWLRHEWLYSSIDREIFLRFNDFQLLLKERFPTLKIRRLTRAQWSTIRRIIGRPRRFSVTFLSEERHTLQEKRKNIQYIQHLISKSSLGPMASEHLDNLLACLPPTIRIPLRLPVGTKVCVNFCTPIQSLYLGFIQDPCSGDGHYGVWIEELILSNDYLEMKSSSCYGLRIVPEEDVFPLPNQPVSASVTLSEIRYHFKENMMSSNVSFYPSVFSTNTENPSSWVGDLANNRLDYVDQSSSACGPLLSEGIRATECHLQVNNSQISTGDILISQPKYNSPPVVSSYAEQSMFSQCNNHQSHTQFLINIIKFYKILERKHSSVKTLKQLNDTAEVKLAENRDNITLQFQHIYANLVLYLNQLNRELKHHMDQVLLHISTVAQEHNMMGLTDITDWRRRVDDEAQEIVCRMKATQAHRAINEGKLDLVTKLISMLIHLSSLSDPRYANQIPAIINDKINEIKQYIHPNNVNCIEATIENVIGQILNSAKLNLFSDAEIT
ncbi:unnamed protein product [Heterobilharzia americana]|nr:unnamed protein product [Heterobilharzia americana]CAH8507207.1 unnamed protein product [Heterobilharzia americana]